MPEADRHRAERDNKRRKKKPRSRKPWELGSEGEETSDGSSTEKVVFLVLDFLILSFYSCCYSSWWLDGSISSQTNFSVCRRMGKKKVRRSLMVSHKLSSDDC